MGLIVALAVFMSAMIASLSTGISMIVPMLVGVIAFGTLARMRGFSIRALSGMLCSGMKESLVVVVVMVLIGCLTSLWRQSGTIAYFTYYGVKLIPPQIFVLAAFLLSAAMSYALGTSFGVAGTIGVIMMTIARASGVSTVIAGGAILSGIYFGDRGSPAASSASLVANETRTDVTKNFRRMLPSSAIPMLICILVYALLSISNRPGSMDVSLLGRFEDEFVLSPWCLLPTILLLAMAFAGMKIKYVMAINIVVSIVLTAILQKAPVTEILRMMAAGYAPRDASLADILSGGGILSMVEICILLLLSSGCAGIFEGTRMLASIESALEKCARRIGRFPAMVLASFGACAIFCNQTIGIIMCRQCMHKNYGEDEDERIRMMLDIENSVVTIAGLVPWCIACSVPLRMLGCDMRSLPFACFLYLIPLCWFVRGKIMKPRQ